jgi:hypothetical protein
MNEIPRQGLVPFLQNRDSIPEKIKFSVILDSVFRRNSNGPSINILRSFGTFLEFKLQNDATNELTNHRKQAGPVHSKKGLISITTISSVTGK